MQMHKNENEKSLVCRSFAFSEMAAQKMEWSLNTLDAIGTFDKDLSTEEKIQESIKAVTPAAEYFPGIRTQPHWILAWYLPGSSLTERVSQVLQNMLQCDNDVDVNDGEQDSPGVDWID